MPLTYREKSGTKFLMSTFRSTQYSNESRKFELKPFGDGMIESPHLKAGTGEVGSAVMSSWHAGVGLHLFPSVTALPPKLITPNADNE